MAAFVGNAAQLFPSRYRATSRCSRRLSVMMSSEAMKDNKMLHVVYRVGSIEKTKEYYTKCLGMEVLRERDVPEDKYTNCFLGYGSERKGEHFSIELTYNYGVDKYDLGNGFKHIGVLVPDVKAAAEKVSSNGGKLIRDAGPTDSSDVPVAIAEDSDGYRFQLIERTQRDPVGQLGFNVGDLAKSVAFYEKALGMTCIRTVNGDDYSSAYLGYGPETDSTVLELTQNEGVTSYEVGDGYGQIAVSTPDVYKAAESITDAGFEVARAPGPVPGIGTKVTAVRDPDGYKIVLVDAEDFELEFE